MKIEIKQTQNDVQITIPKELICFAAEKHPEMLIEILDKEKFVNRFCEGLDIVDPETQLTKIEKFFDDILLFIVENA